MTHGAGNHLQRTEWIENEEATEYVYTDDLVTLTRYILEGVVESVTNYTYVGGKLSQTVTTDSFDYVTTTTYTETTEGTVHFETTEDGEVVASGDVFFNNGSAWKKTVTTTDWSGTYTSTSEVTYDDKNDPLVNVAGYAAASYAEPHWSELYSGHHNTLTYKVDGVTQYSVSYTYNEAGFPVTSASTGIHSDENYTSQYFY